MNKFMKQLLILVATVSAIGFVTVNGTTAHAAKVTKVKRTAYHAKKGNIYTSTKLTKICAKAKTYQNVTLYVTKHATLKQNGKKKVFYYINSKQVKGWLWRGYLRAGKIAPSVASMNPAMARRFLKQTNKYRTAKGMQPVSLDPARMALLKTYKKWFIKGDVDMEIFKRESGKVGLPTDEVFSTFSPITSKSDLKSSKAMSDDAVGVFMLVGESQPDYQDAAILKPKTTKIGVSWFKVKGKVYTMLLTNLYY